MATRAEMRRACGRVRGALHAFGCLAASVLATGAGARACAQGMAGAGPAHSPLLATSQDTERGSYQYVVAARVADLRRPRREIGRPAVAKELGTRSTAGADADGQVPPLGAISPFPIAIRLGLLLSPRTKFAGGVDVTIPKLGLGPGWETRVDGDAIVAANFRGISTLGIITLDQVYSKGLIGGSRLYIGGGIGVYTGAGTRLGEKVFVGAGLSRRLTAEVALHFPGSSNTLLTAQLRLGL